MEMAGGQAVDGVDVRLVHLPEEHPGIRGQRLDIPPLALGKDRVKGQRRLAGTGQTGQDDQLVARNFNGDILQIIDARTLHADTVFHGSLLCRKIE